MDVVMSTSNLLGLLKHATFWCLMLCVPISAWGASEPLPSPLFEKSLVESVNRMNEPLANKKKTNDEAQLRDSSTVQAILLQPCLGNRPAIRLAKDLRHVLPRAHVVTRARPSPHAGNTQLALIIHAAVPQYADTTHAGPITHVAVTVRVLKAGPARAKRRASRARLAQVSAPATRLVLVKRHAPTQKHATTIHAATH